MIEAMNHSVSGTSATAVTRQHQCSTPSAEPDRGSDEGNPPQRRERRPRPLKPLRACLWLQAENDIPQPRRLAPAGYRYETSQCCELPDPLTENREHPRRIRLTSNHLTWHVELIWSLRVEEHEMRKRFKVG